MKKIPRLLSVYWLIVAVVALSGLASCTILQPMRDGSVQHARAPVHAQDQRTKAETLATLEQLRDEADWKVKTLSGGPKLLWLLRKRKLDRLIEEANAGQSVDLMVIDQLVQMRP
jgi:hypothetical protein